MQILTGDKMASLVCSCLSLLLLCSAVGAQTTYARCKIRPSTAGGTAPAQMLTGTIMFKQEGTGPTEIKGEIKGFTSASGTEHGFHVHSIADAGNDCTAMGGHYNPHSKLHGGPTDTERHVGDLGNIVVGSSGRARIQIEDNLVSLMGTYNVVGKSLVVHAGTDDLGKGGDSGSTMTGNAGGRLACCIIEPARLGTLESTCELEPNANTNSDQNQRVRGSIKLTQERGGSTQIKGELRGFNTEDGISEHGFHIHTLSDPNNNCNNMEGHYNPMAQAHGGPTDVVRHFGDMGNIQEVTGGAIIDIEDQYVDLSGTHSVVGRSIVVHEGRDDLGLGGQTDSLTTGAAGGRLACCTITEAVEVSSANHRAALSLPSLLIGLLVARVLRLAV